MAKLKEPKTSRLSWDELFVNMAMLTSLRTACRYHTAAAIIVDKNHKVVSLGYNGPTEGDYHCTEVGCAKVDGDPQTKELKRCRGAHAEMNAIINAQDTTRLRGATMYSVLFPCYDCMKSLNNAGIAEIVYVAKYERIQKGGESTEKEDESMELALKRNIKIRKYEGKTFLQTEGKDIVADLPNSILI
jgi:dCMP deaminase